MRSVGGRKNGSLVNGKMGGWAAGEEGGRNVKVGRVSKWWVRE